MSANIQLVNSMFKLSSISASTEFQPLKEPKTEIPSVELVAEFVKVELQEFRLYVMVGVKDAPLGVADGDMYPRQNLSDFFLVIHDNGLVGSHCPVLFKGCVCAGTVRSGICLPVCRLFYPGSFGGSLQIVYYLHLYVSHDFRGTPLLIGRSVRETAFSHDKDGCLALASTSTFERAVFLSLRRLGGEEPFVYLHISMKIIACVTLAHHVTKLVHHFPYGLVTLAPQLALDFLGGYGTFGRRQEVHGGEPVADGQVASLHHSTGTQGHLMLTVHAGPRTVARIPTQTQTAAAATEKTVAFTETTESLLAGAFVRILTVEVKQIHCVSFQLFYMECLQILFLCLHWHLRACLNFANLDVCGHSLVNTPFIYDRNCIRIYEEITNNAITIDGIDYFVDSISPGYKNSKGANSYVFALYQAQNYIDDGSSVPDRVIKISNKRDNNNSVSEGNKRFYREIEALIECKKRHIHNVVTIASFGQLSCKVKKEGGKGPTYLFPFYTMDYASGDLKNYLENNDIPFGNRIDLCLQIANGLKELKDIGYYHRDLKPDNILMFDDTWKIGDLGLIAFRDKDNIYDKKNDFIGPKGWLSPEAMNKYLQSDNNKYKFDCNIDHQSDVFQLGKVFWYILQGNAPIGNIRRSDFFDGHDDIYSVLKYMLNHSKKKRPISIDYVINELSRIMQKYKFVC